MSHNKMDISNTIDILYTSNNMFNILFQKRNQNKGRNLTVVLIGSRADIYDMNLTLTNGYIKVAICNFAITSNCWTEICIVIILHCTIQYKLFCEAYIH